MNKIKVVWLCTFSNAEKKAHLSLWRRSAFEYGQWIPNLLKGFVGNDRYEVHVVTAEHWMSRSYERWDSNGVVYHCYQPDLLRIPRLSFNYLTRYYFNRRQIRLILANIKPDIVHLFGVENPEYGSVILDLEKRYPVLVTIQGFIHRQRQFNDDYITKTRCKFEKKLLEKCTCYMGDYEAESVVRSFNPHISFEHMYLPVDEDLVMKTPFKEIEYDILFAGNLTKPKGFGDFLELVRLLHQEKPDIKAGVVGYAHVYAEAVPFIEKHGLERNVIWLGRYPSQEGLFQAYRQSKLFIAPTYNDCFASTLRENMLLGTPCVAYRTGGIPYANRDGAENIVLVDQGDVKGLFGRVLDLLTHAEKRLEIAKRAKTFAQKEFSLQANVAVITREYERLLNSESVTR